VVFVGYVAVALVLLLCLRLVMERRVLRAWTGLRWTRRGGLVLAVRRVATMPRRAGLADAMAVELPRRSGRRLAVRSAVVGEDIVDGDAPLA
jgi:hypothetical protein